MSMWKRHRPHKGPRDFREEVGGRVAGKLGLFYWTFVFCWAVLRSIAYGFSLLVSTRAGRIISGLAVVALLLDASWGADPVNLPASAAVVVLLAGVAGYMMWVSRRRWEEHLSAIVYDVVPGHGRSQPEVIWFPPNVGRLISGGRWMRTWDFVFRVPGGMSESKQAEVEQELRSRLPAAQGSTWAFRWDWRSGIAR